jgi:Predicted periplasmic protein
MMIRNKCLWLSLLLAATALLAIPNAQSKPAKRKKAKTTAAEASPAPEASPSLEPKALDILKAASSRLAAARTMKFNAVHFYENPSRQGHPLAFTTKSEVILQRPDKLRVIMPGDGPASEFYYDGKKMMAYAPAENLVAVADAPPTIDAALEQAYHSAAIYFPFADWIVADPYKEMSEGMKLAYYIGQSKVIGGMTTDMVAYIDHGVFIQAWIGVEDKLPRLIHAIYLDDPERLRHTLLLSDWQLDPAVPADTFTSAKAASANPMPFAHPHPEASPAAAAAKGSPSKKQ